MIGHIVALSLKFRVLLISAALMLLAVGALQIRGAPVDELPEFAPPQVQIQTEALGLSAAEVEQLITVPIEHDLFNRSISAQRRSRLGLDPDAGLAALDRAHRTWSGRRRGLLGTVAGLVIAGSVLWALAASALVRRLKPIELLREE